MQLEMRNDGVKPQETRSAGKNDILLVFPIGEKYLDATLGPFSYSQGKLLR